MKRIKIIGILAILLTLLAFSGCDVILESFYPEFAPEQQGGEYGIGIYVEIVIPASEGFQG